MRFARNFANSFATKCHVHTWFLFVRTFTEICREGQKMNGLLKITLALFVCCCIATPALQAQRRVVRAKTTAKTTPMISKVALSKDVLAKVALAQPKKLVNFNKLVRIKKPVFKKRNPRAIKLNIMKKYPLKLKVKGVKQFRTESFQGKKVANRATILKRRPLLKYKPFKVLARPTFLHYVRLYSPSAYPKGKVPIVIKQSLYNSCKSKLNRYIEDVARNGYYAYIMIFNGGSAVNLKNKLRQVKDISGAILVGDIPAAWFENSNDFRGKYAEFPCDLYLMDLNGIWRDMDNDGKFDKHSGAVEPDIWIARWPVHRLGGSQNSTLNKYLDKNHLIRLGKKGYSLNGCAFVDNDWASWGRCSLDKMLGKKRTEKYNNKAKTNATNYKAKLRKKLNWLHFCCHSSPWHHRTYEDKGKINWTDIRSPNIPHAFFYQLFNCSSARFTENNFLGGWYVFGNSPFSLAAVGSAKTGSMKAFGQFYGPMGDGALIGEAFADWFSAQAPYDNHDRQWYYGMCLIGDPIANWTTPIMPRLLSPTNGKVFNHYPRRTTLKWSRVGDKILFFKEYRYELQVDYKYGKTWARNDGRVYIHKKNLKKTSYTFNFVGAQPGRWRVRAVRLDGVKCPWTPWRTFRYTK